MNSADRLQASVSERLSEAGCVAAEDEAAELLRFSADPRNLEDWVCRREAGEPLAWVTGRIEFCGHELAVDAGLYVPRLQSEELAIRAAALLASTQGRAADLCTGAGAIAAHMTRQVPNADVVAVDDDPAAVRCARRNGVKAIRGDCGSALAPRAFDVITAVAPYVPSSEIHLLPRDVQRYEPRHALDGGPDGLALVRRVVTCASRLLHAGGWLLLELGGEQDEALGPTLDSYGFAMLETWVDEFLDLRGLAARLSDSQL